MLNPWSQDPIQFYAILRYSSLDFYFIKVIMNYHVKC